MYLPPILKIKEREECQGSVLGRRQRTHTCCLKNEDRRQDVQLRKT